MKINRTKILYLLLALTLLFSTYALAFTDVKGDPNEKEIQALKDAGIINGVSNEKFAPHGKLTYASGVSLIVKAFDLNIDSLRFVKQPLASDYFTNVPNNAWYSEAFVIAHLNGMPLDKDIDSKRYMTREEFAHLLFSAMMTTGDYAFIEIYMEIKDGDKINSTYMNSIQKLIVSDIVELENGYFYPTREITRSETAKLLHDALKFVDNMNQGELPDTPNSVEIPVTMETVKVNDDINKIILSWGFQNTGHDIIVKRVDFVDDEAHIYYELIKPDPNKVYAQVMVEPKAEVYISSQYTPVLKGELNSSTNSEVQTEYLGK